MKKKSKIYFLFDNFAYFCIRFENGRHLKGDGGTDTVEFHRLRLDVSNLQPTALLLCHLVIGEIIPFSFHKNKQKF